MEMMTIEHYEDDVEWNTGDCDDELEESAYTVGPAIEDPEHLEQFDGNLEDADASASEVYVCISTSQFSFGACSAANLQSIVAWARRARGRETLLRTEVESFQTLVHLVSCQNHRPHVQSLVHRCARSVLPKLAQLVVDHTTLLGFVLISACCVAMLGIVHQNVPTKEQRLQFSPGKRALGTHALGCAMCDAMCHGAKVQKNGRKTRQK